MFKRFVKGFLPMLLALSLLLCGCSDDPDVSGGVTSSGTGAASDTYKLPVIEDVSGTVRYAVRDNVREETEIWLESFNEMYPNITVELVEFTGDLQNFLSTQATAGKMPDVVLGWDNLSPFALQGWLYPLDEFLAKDDEAQYIHQTSLEGFRYEGKIYALPAWLQFSSMIVNLDLCRDLNMDPPDYDWTMDEFLNMAKKATSTINSGINHVESLDQYLMMQIEETGHQWGYNPETKSFNLTSGAFTQAVSFTSDMLKISQLVADSMRNEEITKAGGLDDYSKKFGAKADGLADGKILIACQSTWDDSWMNTSLTKFKWDYYPIPAPTKEQSKQIVHADYGLMLSTAKDPQAAYELLKFITFGKDGLITRMELQNRRNKDNPTNNRFTIPSSSHPDVSARFNGYEQVPDGVKYMYNHMDKSVKGDYSKVLPDYWTVVNDNIYKAKELIEQGQDAATVAKETEKKINEEFAKSYAVFAEKMQKVQQDFKG